MNKLLFLLSFFTATLFGSNILSYNIYDRTDRVDVMLTFDTPYDGKIVKSRTSDKIILKLYDAKIESTKIKHLSSRFLKTLTINPVDGYTQIVATVPNDTITLKASKTADAYGLRLRFLKRSALQSAAHIKKQAAAAQGTKAIFPNLPTKQSEDISTSYYTVIALLIVAILIMLVIKRKINATPTNGSSWLFKGGIPKAPSIKSSTKAPQNGSEEVSIRFQKQIDAHNSVILIDFLEYGYLILLGQSNNILLDRFRDNIPTSQEEFESLLQQKHEKLSEFLQLQEPNPQTAPNEQDDMLKIFSKKASNIPYEGE